MHRVALVVLAVVVAGCAGLGGDAPAGPTPSPTAGSPTETVPPDSTTSASPSPGAAPTETDGSPATTADPGDSSWRQGRVVVAVEGAPDDRAVRPLVERALDYWERNAEQYAGIAPSFVVRPDAADPAVVVTFADRVTSCRDVVDPVGCAPYVTRPAAVDLPARVEVLRGLSNESTTLVLKHEVGHVLGLSHDDEPHSIMAHRASISTLPRPDATERSLPWDDAEFAVYVDAAGADDPATTREQVRHALDYYERGAGGTVPENATFAVTDDRAAADVVVDVGGDLPCNSTAGSCGRRRGVDPDGDGALERYTRLEVDVAGVDADAVGWHVAYWLGAGFGFDDPGDWPAPLRDASARERRSEWWR